MSNINIRLIVVAIVLAWLVGGIVVNDARSNWPDVALQGLLAALVLRYAAKRGIIP